MAIVTEKCFFCGWTMREHCTRCTWLKCSNAACDALFSETADPQWKAPLPGLNR